MSYIAKVRKADRRHYRAYILLAFQEHDHQIHKPPQHPTIDRAVVWLLENAQVDLRSI